MREDKRFFGYLMVLAMLLWGAGWPALKVVTPDLPLEVVTFWRFVIMFLAFVPLLVYLKEPLRLPRRSVKYILLSSVCNILFMVFAFMGVKYGTAGGGGVVITTLSPLLTFGLVALVYKQRMLTHQYAGLFVGLAGGLVMLRVGESDLSAFLSGGELFFVLSALVWAFVTLLSQRSHLHINPLHYSFFISAVATVVMLFAALPHGIAAVFDQGWAFWGALLYLGIFGQTVATTIYFFAAGNMGSGAASSFMFMVPLSALFFSYILLGEALQPHILIGGSISLLAVYIINKKRLAAPKKAP